LEPVYIYVTIDFISCDVNDDVWEKLGVVNDIRYLLWPGKLDEETHSKRFFEKQSTNHVGDTLENISTTD